MNLQPFATFLDSRLAPSSSQRYLASLRQYLAWLGDRPPDGPSARRFLEELAKSGKARGTVGTARAALGLYLRFLGQEKDFPPLPPPTGGPDPLSEDEVQLLLQTCRRCRPRLANLMGLLLETGLGEAVTELRPEHLQGQAIVIATLRYSLSPELASALAQKGLPRVHRKGLRRAVRRVMKLAGLYRPDPLAALKASAALTLARRGQPVPQLLALELARRDGKEAVLSLLLEEALRLATPEQIRRQLEGKKSPSAT